MSHDNLGRRRLMTTTLGTVAAVGLGAGGGLLGAGPAGAASGRPVRTAAAATTSPTYPACSVTAAPTSSGTCSTRHALPRGTGAGAGVHRHRDRARDGWERAIFDAWMAMAATSDYPHNFIEYVTPIKGPLAVLSKAQLGVFDTYYRPGGRGIVSAFADFAQGVLYDPAGSARCTP